MLPEMEHQICLHLKTSQYVLLGGIWSIQKGCGNGVQKLVLSLISPIN